MKGEFRLWPKQEAIEAVIAAAPPRVLLLPPPPKGRSVTEGGYWISPEARAAREWMAGRKGP